MEIIYRRLAEKGRKKVPTKVREQLDTRVRAFAKDPEAAHHGGVKPLKRRVEFSIRQGKYRALVEVREDALIVRHYGHRKDAYEEYDDED